MSKVTKEAKELISKSNKDPDKNFYLARKDEPDLYIKDGKRLLFYSDRLIEVDGELVTGDHCLMNQRRNPLQKLLNLTIVLALCFFTHPAKAADSVSMDQQLSVIQGEWARIKYQVPDKDTKLKDFAKLEENAATLTSAFPDKAEPKIWQAIVLATDAGVINGISALPKLKTAKQLLETAISINPTALKGAAQGALGSLYYRVPGWPISFGDNKKAETYLTAALKINPDGIDPNYFYGDYLIQKGQYDKAIPTLEHALQASPRPGREVADAGRHQEIKAAIDKAKKELESSNTSTLNR